MKNQKGWKPMPVALKILFAFLILWSFGAVMNLPNLMKSGLPLFGVFITGMPAGLVAIFLDIIGPMVFLCALWNRKIWGVKWAFFYIGLFILNSIVALLTVSDVLGLPQILMPTIVSTIFLTVIYWKRLYFFQK